jgi:hypothetical protein
MVYSRARSESIVNSIQFAIGLFQAFSPIPLFHFLVYV